MAETEWKLIIRPGRKGYNPDQPRVPAGQTGGGRWTGGEDGGGDVDFFETSEGQSLLSGLPRRQQIRVQHAFSAERIDPIHLSGLESVTVQPPAAYPGWKSISGVSISGFYDSSAKTIHINPNSLGSSTLYHELGHHLELGNDNFRNRRKTNPISEIATDKLYTAYERLSEGAPLSKSDLRRIGLRPYSLTDNLEFYADVYKTYISGFTASREGLASFIGLKDLEELFIP